MYLGLPWIDAACPKLNYSNRRMLFKGKKAKDKDAFQQVAIEDAKAFDRSMRDPTADVYACLVNFVGETATVGATMA
jgi:hypothetical protein